MTTLSVFSSTKRNELFWKSKDHWFNKQIWSKLAFSGQGHSGQPYGPGMQHGNYQQSRGAWHQGPHGPGDNFVYIDRAPLHPFSIKNSIS